MKYLRFFGGVGKAREQGLESLVRIWLEVVFGIGWEFILYIFVLSMDVGGEDVFCRGIDRDQGQEVIGCFCFQNVFLGIIICFLSLSKQIGGFDRLCGLFYIGGRRDFRFGVWDRDWRRRLSGRQVDGGRWVQLGTGFFSKLRGSMFLVFWFAGYVGNL